MKGTREIAVLVTAMLLLSTSCGGGSSAGTETASVMTEESMAGGSYANAAILPRNMELTINFGQCGLAVLNVQSRQRNGRC